MQINLSLFFFIVPVPKICSLGLSKGLSGCMKAAGEKGGGRKGEVRGKERNL